MRIVYLQKLELSEQQEGALWELNRKAVQLYNSLLSSRQEILAIGEKPREEIKEAVARRGELPKSVAKEILQAMRRATAKGNWARRAEARFWPLIWRKEDFLLIENGQTILLSIGARLLRFNLKRSVREAVRRAMISQDWARGTFFLRFFA